MSRFIDATLRLIDNFTSPMNNAVSSLERNARNIQNQGKQIEAAGNGIASMGSSLTKAVTVPVAGIGVMAIKTAADFEEAMTEVKVIAGATGDEFGMLKTEAQRLGATTKFSAQESAEAMQYMAQAGWDTNSILAGTEGVMNAAASSGENLATVAGILSKNITAFGDSAEDANRYADVMSAAAAVSAADINYLGEAYKYCASTAGSMSYGVEDISIALAAMSQAGIEAGTAGASVRNIIANMAKPTRNQLKVMEKLGLSLVDNEGKTKSFATVMNDLRSSFGKLSESEKASAAAGLAGKESMAALLSLVNTSDKDFEMFSEAINNSTGTAKKMADEMQNNLNGQITLLKSALEGAAIAIGDKLLPYIKEATTWVQKAVDKFNGLSDSQQNMIIKFSLIAAAVGPAILIFGKMVTGVGKVVTMVGNLGIALSRAGGIIGLLTSPAGIVIGILAAIAVAAVLVVKNFDKIKPVLMQVKEWFVSTFGESIKNAITKFKDLLGKVVSEVQAKLPSIMQAAKSALELVLPAIKSIASALGKMIPAAMEVMKTVFKEIGPIVQTVIATIAKHLPAVTGTIKKVVNSVAPVIKSVVGTIAKIAPIIASTFVSVAKKLTPVIKTIATGIRAAIPIVGNLFSKAFEFVGNTIAKVMPFVKQVVDIVGGAIVFAVQKAAPIVSKLADTFAIVFNAIAEKIGNFIIKVQFVWTMIQPIVSKIGEIAKNVFDVVLGGVLGAAAGYFENFINTAKEVFIGVMTVFGGIIDFITGVFTGNWDKAWNGIKDIFKGVFESIGAVAKTALNGVIGIVNSAISGINKIGFTTPDWLPGGLGGKSFKLDIPKIPMLYTGTTNWKGGPAVIHDRGAEIVDLPSGTRVYPHDKSIQMARAEGTKTTSISIAKLADTIVVREEADIDRIATAIVKKIEKTACNMA